MMIKERTSNMLLSWSKLTPVFTLAAFMIACASEQAPDLVDCETTGPSLVLDDQTDTQCGVSAGGFTFTATGGEGTLTYKLNDQAVETAGTLEDLAAGTYTLTVSDENECSDELVVTISNLDGVNITSAEATVSGCGSTNGTISIAATGGVPPYQYKVGSGAFQESEVLSGLGTGTHTVTVTDANECETSTSAKILSGVSFEQSIMPIIDLNCAASDCHGGSQSPNLTTLATIQSVATTIKAVTKNKTMPKVGSLTEEEIDLIACWVDDGALNN